MADTVALHQAVLSRDELLAGRYIAVRLSDGGSDGAVYDTRADAIAHQVNSPSRCAYFRVPFDRWSAATCDVLLWYVRCAYDNGVREDPAHALIIPQGREELVDREIEGTYGART
jgi:hypothetical protein